MENQECDCCSAESVIARNEAIVYAAQCLMRAAKDLLERVELDCSLPYNGVYTRTRQSRGWLNAASLLLDSLDFGGTAAEVEEEE